jgi:hypothetical protein
MIGTGRKLFSQFVNNTMYLSTCQFPMRTVDMSLTKWDDWVRKLSTLLKFNERFTSLALPTCSPMTMLSFKVTTWPLATRGVLGTWKKTPFWANVYSTPPTFVSIHIMTMRDVSSRHKAGKAVSCHPFPKIYELQVFFPARNEPPRQCAMPLALLVASMSPSPAHPSVRRH